MKGKNIVWAIVIIVIIGLGIYFAGRSAKAPDQSGPIKIGFVGPLTGDVASLGTSAKAAVEVAIDEINKAGGINGRQVSLIAEDGKCGAEALNAATKLFNVDKVSFIIGGLCSGETSSFVKTIGNQIPVISYGSSAPTLSGMAKYFSRDYPSDAFQGKFAAEYLYNTLGARKVVVFYHVSDWGTGVKTVFEQRFKELGGQVLDEEGSPQTTTDYRTQITKIKSVGSIDYIYMPMYQEGGTIAINQLNQLGVKTKLFGADAFGDPKFQKDVIGKADILYSEVSVPSNSEFNAKVLAKSGAKEVPLGSPQAYDAMNLIAQIAAKVGTDPQKFTDALRAVNYSGVSGQISFDKNGDLATVKYVVMRIANGTKTEVK